MVHDELPRGVRDHISHSIRQLERFSTPVNDTLDTLQHLARPLTVGLEDEYRSLDRLIQSIKERWAFFETNGAWPSSGEHLGQARASAHMPVTTKAGEIESSGESS